jgi:hypothetical protein
MSGVLIRETGFTRRIFTQHIQSLDPDRDHQQICHLLVGYLFPWDITRALELALLRTFCIPSISKLLDRTGEFQHHGQKRYDDTGLIVSKLLQWGYEDPRGMKTSATCYRPLFTNPFVGAIATPGDP